MKIFCWGSWCETHCWQGKSCHFFCDFSKTQSIFIFTYKYSDKSDKLVDSVCVCFLSVILFVVCRVTLPWPSWDLQTGKAVSFRSLTSLYYFKRGSKDSQPIKDYYNAVVVVLGFIICHGSFLTHPYCSTCSSKSHAWFPFTSHESFYGILINKLWPFEKLSASFVGRVVFMPPFNCCM